MSHTLLSASMSASSGSMRLLIALVTSFFLLLVGGAPVRAAVIAVSTTEDLIAFDAECSLREAVTAANTNAAFSDCPAGDAAPIIDVIELQEGTYALTLEPSGEDANLGGDLDILESVTIRGLGEDFFWWDDPDSPDLESLDVYNDPSGFPRVFTEDDLPSVVIENGLGTPTTPGDGDRVLHVLDPLTKRQGKSAPEGEQIPQITIENLAITGGDASCSGASCIAGAAGLFHTAEAGLTLRRVVLFENRVSCSGLACGSATNTAALRYEGTYDLRILDSVVAGNTASCADTECEAGRLILGGDSLDPTLHAVEFDRTLISGNRQSCSATDCRVRRALDLAANDIRITQTAFSSNESSCEAAGSSCDTDEFLQPAPEGNAPCNDATCSLLFEDVEFSDNQLTCEGQDCDTDELINPRVFFSQVFRRVRLQDNVQMCSGFSCDVDELMDIRGEDAVGAVLELEDLEVLDNVNMCSGTECDADNVLFLVARSPNSISNVLVRGESLCIGDRCSARELVDLEGFASITGLTVDEGSLACTGIECEIRPLVRIRTEPPLDPVVETLRITNSQSICTGLDCGSSPGFIGDGGVLILPTPQSGATSVSIRDATITGNLTSARGSLANGTSLDIADSVISGNQSASDGGAIFNGVSSFDGGPVVPGNLLLSQTVIDGNVSERHGGGVFNPPGATLAWASTSITNNTALDGGGVFNEGTIVLQQDSILENNAPNQCVNSGMGIGCDALFIDGFESGDTSAWSNAQQSQ